MTTSSRDRGIETGQPTRAHFMDVRNRAIEAPYGHMPGTCYVCDQMRSIHQMLDTGDLDLIAGVADEVTMFHDAPMVVDEHGDYDLVNVEAVLREFGKC
jgi:hypothetical protein